MCGIISIYFKLFIVHSHISWYSAKTCRLLYLHSIPNTMNICTHFLQNQVIFICVRKILNFAKRYTKKWFSKCTFYNSIFLNRKFLQSNLSIRNECGNYLIFLQINRRKIFCWQIMNVVRTKLSWRKIIMHFCKHAHKYECMIFQMTLPRRVRTQNKSRIKLCRFTLKVCKQLNIMK